MLFPRILSTLERIMATQEGEAVDAYATMSADSVSGPRSVMLNEQHGDIDFREFESLTPEAINEIEEWNRQNPTLTIYDDDVVIEDGKVVE
jgi:hypothetical protein